MNEFFPDVYRARPLFRNLPSAFSSRLYWRKRESGLSRFQGVCSVMTRGFDFASRHICWRFLLY